MGYLPHETAGATELNRAINRNYDSEGRMGKFGKHALASMVVYALGRTLLLGAKLKEINAMSSGEARFAATRRITSRSA